MKRTAIDRIAVIVHGQQGPTDEEWAAWLADYRAQAEHWDALLIYSHGGAPNGRQRGELAKVFGELRRNPVPYVVTSSALMRGVVTAIGWFLPEHERARTYSLGELEQALSDLRASPVTRAAIERFIRERAATFSKAVSR